MPGRALRPYLIALAAVAAAIAVTTGARAVSAEVGPGLFYVAIAGTALFGGWGPALAAIALSTFAVGALVTPPLYEGLVALGVFAGSALTITALVGVRTRLQERRRRAEHELRKSHRALRESEERYRRIVETAHEGIWLVDGAARTLFANRRMAEMLGITPDEMTGRAVHEFVFPEDRELTSERIGRNLRGAPEQFDFRFRHASGRTVHVLGCTSAVTCAAGEVLGTLGMFSDITARKLAVLPSTLVGVTVLVVDDDRDAREALALALEAYGADVMAAESPAAAVVAFGRRTPDVLVTDLSMPHEDGYSLLRRVRAFSEPRARGIPAVAVTGYASEHDRARSRAAGFAVHIAKPVDPRTLGNVVAELVHGRTADTPPAGGASPAADPP